MIHRRLFALTLTLAALAATNLAAAAAAAAADWPQWRGPNRDGVAINSPKLADAWPTNGPALLWQSEWIPGFHGGGCAGPVVADGNVFVYANAKLPKDGSKGYRFITPEVLLNCGWIPGISTDQVKIVEEAWASKDRPKSKWNWCDFKGERESDKAVDEFLAANPELEKYIKDVLAKLNPDVVEKHAARIRRRLCIPSSGAYSWDKLVNLSKMQDTSYPKIREWAGALRGPTGEDHKSHHLAISGFLRALWRFNCKTTDTMCCLDAATGKTLWRKDLPLDDETYKNLINGDWDGKYIDAGEFLGISATPAAWNGKIYFVGAMGVYCLSARDGAKLWQVKAPLNHHSPLVADGVVYHCGTAYDAETGKELWKLPRWRSKVSQWSYTSPSLWRSGGRTYVLGNDGGNLICCLDLKTGQELWTLRYRTPYNFMDFGNRADSDLLSSEGKVYKMSATTNGLQELRTFLDFPRMVFGEKVVYQDHLYQHVNAQEGSKPKFAGLCCFDLKTGEMKWTDKHPAWGTYPFIAADNKLIVPYNGDYVWETWKVALIRATPEKYEQLGLFDFGLIPWAAMALADGKLVVRREDCIACYDLREHGIYLDGVTAGKDAITFAFKQTGGGLVAKDLGDVLVTDAAGVGKLAAAKINGDTVVVDTKGLALPFDVTYAGGGALTGRNNLPVPAFARKALRLQISKCQGNAIQLVGSQTVAPEFWRSGVTLQVGGATVTNLTGNSRRAWLFADKDWKPGETIAISAEYACLPDEPTARARVALHAPVIHVPEVTFVKTDETTSGNWKGVYGSQGAVLVGETGTVVACATVVSHDMADDTRDTGGRRLAVWDKSSKDARALLKPGPDAQNRIAACWVGDRFDVDVGITDAKEHQVAFYCLDWDKYNGGRMMKVEARDPDSGAVLDTQAIKEFTAGKYLVWNVQGQVIFHFIATGPGNWHDMPNGVISGVFVDPVNAATR